MKKGLVTMADILGWKGIWRIPNRNPVKDLLDVKKSLLNYDERIDVEKRSIIVLDFLFKKYPKLIVEFKIFTNNLNAFPRIYKQKFSNLLDSIDETGYGIKIKEEIQIKYFNILHQSGRGLLNWDRMLSVFIEVNKNLIDREEVKKAEFEIDVEVKIDLISDTFIICSFSNDKLLMLDTHGKVVKFLIEECLRKDLLIRGATGFGDYYTESLIFVGPVIDEVASWHEMAQEVAVFAIPSVSMNFDKELKESEYFVEHEVCFKSRRFVTHCVKWEDCDGKFVKIAENESPILPEFADKYINTLKYLEENKKLMVKYHEKKNKTPAVISLTNY